MYSAHVHSQKTNLKATSTFVEPDMFTFKNTDNLQHALCKQITGIL